LNVVEPEVLTTVVRKSSVFWDIMPCIPFKAAGVSEKHVASNFRVEDLASLILGIFFVPEFGNMFFRNAG
jgi:hypothetical protein